MKDINTLSERINYALNITGIKKSDLARIIGVKPQVIQFLCNSQTQSSRFTFEIASALGLNNLWLATGEGEIFIKDDPVTQFCKLFDQVPVFSAEHLREYYIKNKKIDELNIESWLPLKKPNDASFALYMSDVSMEPFLPHCSQLFITEKYLSQLDKFKYVLVFLEKFDTFLIREIQKQNDHFVLISKNKELFKDIKFDENVQLLGHITDCIWHIGK